MKVRFGTIAITIVTIAALIVCIVTLRRALFRPNLEDEGSVIIAAPAVTSHAASSTYPVKLEIPSIGVSAAIQRVGISKHGTMAVPTNYTDVGWYRYGPFPGERGSAVMAGHLDNGFGLSAVFEHLANLNVGDDVYVLDAKNTRLHFKVTKTAAFDPATDSTQEIFTKNSPPRLNIITCEGTWNAEKKMYSNRLVVFTELVQD
jgi:LPXTG-site transpeptidase (sortase) family protein